MVLIGQLSKDHPGIDSSLLKKSGAILRSIGVGDRPMLEELARAVKGRSLRPVIDKVFAFKEAKQAFARLQNGDHIGKDHIRTGSIEVGMQIKIATA